MIKTVIASLFGSYVPITYDILASDGAVCSVIPDGLSGVDWLWLGGFSLFALTFYCTMRIVGGILSGK